MLKQHMSLHSCSFFQLPTLSSPPWAKRSLPLSQTMEKQQSTANFQKGMFRSFLKEKKIKNPCLDHHIWPSFIAIYSLAVTQPVKHILMCRSWEMPNCTACWGCPHVVGSQQSWGKRHHPPHCHSTQTSLASSNITCRSAETCLPSSWHAMSPNLYFRKHFQSL